MEGLPKELVKNKAITFSVKYAKPLAVPARGSLFETITVPCGRCLGCKIARTKEWAVRCTNEAMMHKRNCFITLTFNKKHLNKKGTLVKSDFKNFMKRLRIFKDRYEWNPEQMKYQKRKHAPLEVEIIKYYHCGEYGDDLLRPHHHACIFGHDFDDKKPWDVRDGVVLYRSEALEKIWSSKKGPIGYATIGEVNWETAAYTARYVLKKITGPPAPDHYQGKLPEYTSMSLKYPIGLEWLKKYKHSDCYDNDWIMTEKRFKAKPPRYYDKKFGEMYPEEMEGIKQKREQYKLEHQEKYNPDRLKRLEEITKLEVSKMKRKFR